MNEISLMKEQSKMMVDLLKKLADLEYSKVTEQQICT